MASTSIERRHVALGYFFWVCGLVGLCGMHRFYARKPVSGTLWLLTFGFCGIGQLIDGLLISSMIEQANQPLALQEALAMAEANRSDPLARQLLVLARSSGSTGFTLNDAILTLQLPVNVDRAAVRAEIEVLLNEQLLDVGNDERGRVVYREP